LRPVPQATQANCEIISGKVIDIYQSGTKDLSIKLEDHSDYFYINRGLESGLNLSALKKQILNQDCKLSIVNHGAPLDPLK